MFLSCLFTYPIYSPPLNEILEETVVNKRTVGIFVSDNTRLMYRILQTIGISLVAWFCPFFGDIISLDILIWLNEWLLRFCKWFEVDSSFIVLGGFVFTAISCVIPPILHLYCYSNTMSVGTKVIHYIAIAINTIFMIVSTGFSGYVLLQKMLH